MNGIDGEEHFRRGRARESLTDGEDLLVLLNNNNKVLVRRAFGTRIRMRGESFLPCFRQSRPDLLRIFCGTVFIYFVNRLLR